MHELTHAIRTILDQFAQGNISAPIALMELLLESRSIDAVHAIVADTGPDSIQLAELQALLRNNAAGCERISEMLKLELDVPAQVGDAALERIRHQFDVAVQTDAAASVAFYSLGSDSLLAEATAELVRVFDTWGTLHASHSALEIGCGIGRIMLPLSTRLSRVVGTDISSQMVATARAKLSKVSNAEVCHTSGRDLASFRDGTFGLVYAVDVFPYLVEAGSSIVLRHFEEISRVLQHDGDFILFNFAYGGTRERNAAEVRRIAAGAGLQLIRSDIAPFQVWNGIGYHLRK